MSQRSPSSRPGRAMLLMVAAGSCLCCAKPPFSDPFLWGTAIAGFQVDMGCPTLAAEECEDRGSDWYEFITTTQLPDTAALVTRQPPSSGPGHWELYEQDFDRAKGMGLGSVRLSLEWSRIFPRATDGVEGHEALRAMANPAALERYHAMLAALKARGLTPLVTLNHYTLPTWIHDPVGCHKDLEACDRKGWVDRARIVREISRYAGFVAKEFGSEIDWYATLNEPFAVILPGYLLPTKDRTNPPAVTLQYDAARTVMNAMIEAHAAMYTAVHANDVLDADADGSAAQVGLVYSTTPVHPKDPANRLDQRAAENLFKLNNTLFLDAVCRGDFDEQLTGKPTRREDLVGRMDWLGINYYTRIIVSGTEEPVFPTLSPLTTFDPFSLTQGAPYPRGLHEMVLHLQQRYAKPMIVTENGVADPDDDGTGTDFLVRHLQWLQRAMAAGADVRGYFWWSLMDNYEWNHGMDLRFGLYAVDPADPSKARTARRTVASYQEIVRAGQVPTALVDAHLEPEP